MNSCQRLGYFCLKRSLLAMNSRVGRDFRFCTLVATLIHIDAPATSIRSVTAMSQLLCILLGLVARQTWCPFKSPLAEQAGDGHAQHIASPPPPQPSSGAHAAATQPVQGEANQPQTVHGTMHSRA